MSEWQRILMLRFHKWIHLQNVFTMQTKMVYTIKSSQIVCVLMNQTKRIVPV